MKMKKIQVIFVMILFLVSSVSAQNSSDIKKPEYLWAVNGNMGYSLLWGDAGSQNSNPFARWFSEDESAFSYGLTLQRKLNETFKLQLGVVYGSLNSKRETWTDDTHPLITAQTTYLDYHLGVNVDFTAMFGAKPDRLISFYGLVGVGMANYSAESQNDGVSMPSREVEGANTVFIPWGWGLDFRINERFHITFENTFRHTFVDDFDAYIGTGSDLNDFYSITGLGVTYKFGQKRKKKEPKVIEEPVELVEDNVVAVKEPVSVNYKSSIPNEASPNSEYLVNSIIDKGDLTGTAIYELDFPEDFYVSDVVVEGAKVELDSSILRVKWESLPAGNLMVSYKLSTGGLDKESYILNSKFSYKEDDEDKLKTFSNRVNLKPEAVAVVDTKEATKKETVEQKSEVEAASTVVPTSNYEIEYRVQVAAAFGGTVSKGLLKKRLGLSDDVKEDPYKNSYRYTVGSYKTYSEAAQNSALSKVRGSYVVAFKNGKYVGGLEKLNENIMDKDGIYSTGLTYKVQIAASKGRTYSISKLAYKYGLKENEITEDEISGWYQYTVGKFRTSSEAKPTLNKIKAKVPRAYIVKFTDGKR